MAKMQREKGARGERELAEILRRHGYESHRGAQHKGGADSPDVTGLPGIHIECKRTEKLRLYDALEQAARDSGTDIPVVMHRMNNRPWVAIMALDDFIRMYGENNAEVD